MSKKKRELTGDEKKLWRRVAATVKPRRPGAVAESPPEHEGEPRSARPPPPAVVRQAPSISPATRTVTAPPNNRGAEKRVRRGRLDIAASLDLHGHTQDTARAALAGFLRAAHRRGDRTVIVVTGMGRGGEGVLKRRFPEWLSEPSVRPLVSGYAPAHRSHGGAGAFYVFLKRAD